MVNQHACPPLGIYGLRASSVYKFVLETVTPENRSTIVSNELGLHDVPIICRADGIVFFDFPKIEKYAGGSVPSYSLPPTGVMPENIQCFYREREKIRSSRYRYMNAFLAYLYSYTGASSILPSPVHPNRFIATDRCDRFAKLFDNGSCDLSSLPIFDPISEDQLRNTVTRFRKIDHIEEVNDVLEFLEFYYRAAYHKENLETSTALIILWAIIERAQNLLWNKFIIGGYKSVAPHARVQGQRKKVLLNDRNYTASIKTQILALGNVLFDQDVELIDQARKRRNDFMHSMADVDHGDVASAQWAAARLIKKNFDIEVKPFGATASWDYTR
jgi:hypothetical protein